MEKITKVLMTKEGEMFFWKKNDLHTRYGFVRESTLKKAKRVVETNLKKKFFVMEPNFTDLVRKMKREPQMPLLKDVAIIIAYSGIGKESKVVDAGTGSGLLAASMGRVASNVVSYEKNPRFAELAKENMEFLGISNVKIKNKDIEEGIKERNLDLITLDLPEPWRLLNHAEKSLKQGGFLVTYLPTISQVSRFVEEAIKYSFIIIKTIEIMERGWHVEGVKLRPKTQMIGHTAFLTFARRV